MEPLRISQEMKDWNVVVSVAEHGYKPARKALAEFGNVAKTDFYNVLVMQVEDPRQLLADWSRQAAQDPELGTLLSRMMPVSQTFTFQSAEEFEAKAKEAVLSWIPALAGKGFHVRMHRRGFKGRLTSQGEEQFLDGWLLEKLDDAGTPGRISFEDPDAILAVETVNQRAGLSFWTREALQRYPLLKLD